MIQSLMRSLDLLEVLKGADHKISIAELSEQLELPPSTIHRILQTFCEKKYVIRDEYTHTYCLGPALISLGRAAASNVRIQDAALPILKNLSYVTREDSYLVIQVGDKGLVLDKVDGPNHLKVGGRIRVRAGSALRSHPQGHSGLPEPGIPGLLHQTGLRPSGGLSADQPERPSGRASRNP